MAERVTVNRHLYLTEDRCRVVEEGDPAGRWLHWAPGHLVPQDEYERLLRPAPKRRGRPPGSKSRTPSENK
ncbi:hypothetical protein ACMA1D_10705 [Streptomyces sp. 796.1]|uniref:hypothetical protein n=1 Tax=Streptomyces sp. 796.1 TaxID=3163029 RepID=UPI0039C92ACA